MKNKTEELAKDDAEFEQLIAQGRMCPACNSFDIIKGYHEGDLYAPETDYDECCECGTQWNLE